MSKSLPMLTKISLPLNFQLDYAFFYLILLALARQSADEVLLMCFRYAVLNLMRFAVLNFCSLQGLVMHFGFGSILYNTEVQFYAVHAVGVII